MTPDAPEMPMMSRRLLSVFVILGPFDAPRRRVRRDAAAPPLPVALAPLHPVAARRLRRIAVPFVGPVAERIAVPRRLRPQRRQAELLPQRTGFFHMLPRGKRERRHRR